MDIYDEIEYGERKFKESMDTGKTTGRLKELDSQVNQAYQPKIDIDRSLKAKLETENKKESALDIQVGGHHYKYLKIQPMTYSMENGLNACQHTAIKYITRYKSKGGIEDLRKAIHSIELLIEFEEKDK